MTKPHPSIIKQAEAKAAELPEALITVIDIRGVFHYVSPSSVSITGYTSEEALGKPFAQFVNPDDAPALYMAAQNALLNERSPETHLRTKIKSGGERPMRGYAIKLLDPVSGDAYLLSVGYLLDQ